MSPPDRRTDGTHRFRSAYTDADLRHIVSELTHALSGDGGDPRDVEPETFDAAIPTSQWPDCPRSDRICRRLKMTWPEFMDVLASPKRDSARTTSARRRPAPTKPRTTDDARHALQLVAEFLSARTLRPSAYEQGALAFEGKGRGRERDRKLPTDDQIIAACGSWEQALEIAGLDPVQRYAGGPRGISLELAIGEFLRDVGCLPWALSALREYARQRGVSVTSQQRFDEELQRFVGRRLYEPGWVPYAPPLKDRRPEIAVSRDPTPRVRRRRKDWSNRDVLVDGIARAYKIAREHERDLGTEYHRALACAHDSIPHPSVVVRWAERWRTTPEALRKEALGRSLVAR